MRASLWAKTQYIGRPWIVNSCRPRGQLVRNRFESLQFRDPAILGPPVREMSQKYTVFPGKHRLTAHGRACRLRQVLFPYLSYGNGVWSAKPMGSGACTNSEDGLDVRT